MARLARPTDAELAVLRVLWTHGPSTVREVHDRMAGARRVGYTTTLKTLQVMTGKGLTLRETHRGQHLYRPSQAEDVTQRHLVADFIDRAFGGATSRLIVHALASRPASAERNCRPFWSKWSVRRRPAAPGRRGNAMRELWSFADNPLARSIAIALLQFLWQAALVCARCRRCPASVAAVGGKTRYLLAIVCLAVMCVLPAVTVTRIVLASPGTSVGSLASSLASPNELVPRAARWIRAPRSIWRLGLRCS